MKDHLTSSVRLEILADPNRSNYVGEERKKKMQDGKTGWTGNGSTLSANKQAIHGVPAHTDPEVVTGP